MRVMIGPATRPSHRPIERFATVWHQPFGRCQRRPAIGSVLAVEANRESRSLASLLRIGVAGVVFAAFFVDGWVFGTSRGDGWIGPGMFDGGIPSVMVGVGCVMVCALVWAVWPRSTPYVAVLASLGSLAISSRLDDRIRFPFFTESVVLILMLAAVLWRRALWSWPLAALVVIAGESISLRAGDGGVRSVLAAAMFVLFAAVIIVVAYSGMKDKERHDSIEAARRNERLELARELHDVVGHHVTGIVVLAQANRFAAASGGAGSAYDTDRTLADIERAGLETLTSVRRLVGLLRDDAPTTAGPQFADVERLVADLQATHPHAVLEADTAIRTTWVPADLTTTVHRVVQEATTNVRKHGDPDAPVTVVLRRNDVAIAIEVRNGTRPATTGSGYGLIGMRERVEALGGSFDAGPAGAGIWLVQATLPLSGPS
jgi:hypothetical protein